MTVPLALYPCECCADTMNPSTLADLEVVAVRALLKPTDFRMHELYRGATTVGRSQAAKVLDVGTTRFQELINDGTIPEGMVLGNKRVWLEIELLRTRAKIIERDTLAGARIRPANRFERPKSSSSDGNSALKRKR